MNDLPLPFDLTVDPLLSPLIECAPVAEKIRIAATASLRGLMRELGLPVAPLVQWRCEPVPVGIALRVRGRDLPYPHDLFAQAWNSWSASDPAWREWAALHVAQGGWERARDDAAVCEEISAFIARLVSAIAAWRPDRLFDSEVAAAWLAKARIQGTSASSRSLSETGYLARILHPILALGIAITDAATILPLLTTTEVDPADITEELIDRLRPGYISLLAHPSYWHELVPGIVLPRRADDPVLPGETRMVFQRLREDLFFRLGLHVPQIQLVAEDSLPPRMLALRIHHVTLVAWRGLAPGELFAEASADFLKGEMSLDAAPAQHPVARVPGAVIAAGAPANPLEARGIPTWTPISYAALCIEKQLRRRAAALVSLDRTEADLAALHVHFPDLVLAALERVPLPRMAQLTRLLAAEQTSVRNSRTILESVATFDTIVADGQSRIVLDDRLVLHPRLAGHASKDEIDDIVAFVRMGLKLQIEAQSRRSGTLLRVLTLDQAVENSLLELFLGSGGEESVLVAAPVRSQLAAHISANWNLQAPPVVITKTTLRRTVRALIGDELPEAAVIAYDELPTNCSIEPIGSVSFVPASYPDHASSLGHVDPSG